MRRPLHPLLVVLSIGATCVVAILLSHIAVAVEPGIHRGALLLEGGLAVLLSGLLVFQLVRQRTRAERALQESVARLRSIVEGAQAGYFRIDPQGAIVDANPAFLRLHGRTLPQIRGTAFELLLAASDRPRARALVLQALGGRSISSAELARDQGEGSAGWETLTLRPLQDGGQVRGAEGFVIDTTDLRRAQSDYKGLFESMEDAFALHEIVHDADGRPCDYRFVRVNPAFEGLVQRRAEDIVGRTALEIFPALGREWIDRYSEVATTGQPIRFREFAPHIGKWVEVVAFSHEKARIGAILQDVTAEQQAAVERASLEERLQQAEKMDAIGHLAGGVAHDFNNMLAGIMGYADLIRRKVAGLRTLCGCRKEKWT